MGLRNEDMGFVGGFGGLSTKRTRTFQKGSRVIPCAILGGSKIELRTVEWGSPKGEGSYGSVFFGSCGNTGERIVVKCAKDVPLANNLIETEKYVNKKLSNVKGRWAEYLGDYSVPMDVDVPKGTARKCLVWKMEGDGSSLQDYITRFPRERLSEVCGVFEDTTKASRKASCKFVVRELLCALVEMHEKGIMHRDIKPANIIVAPGTQYPFKIIDFGSACDWKTPLKRGLSNATCDPVYAAPERRINIMAPDKFDVFAVGLIGIQILMPSLSETWQISDFKYRLESNGYNLVKWCQGIVEAGGTSCDAYREVHELYNDPELLPTLTQMLAENPSKRASAIGALASGAFGQVVFGED